MDRVANIIPVKNNPAPQPAKYNRAKYRAPVKYNRAPVKYNRAPDKYNRAPVKDNNP